MLHLMYVDDIYAFVKQIYYKFHPRLDAKETDAMRNAFCVFTIAFPPRIYSYTLCESIQVAQSTFFIFILRVIYIRAYVYDARVRACLRFIRLLTIRDITNGAKAFVYRYIATIFASFCL